MSEKKNRVILRIEKGEIKPKPPRRRRLRCPPPLLPTDVDDASECHVIRFAARLRAPLVVRLSDGAQKIRGGCILVLKRL
jgi:hypothetical protein